MVCAFWFSLSVCVWVNGDKTFSFGSLTRIGFNRRPSIMLLLLLQVSSSSSSLPQSKQTATRTTAVDRLHDTPLERLVRDCMCVGVGCICKDGCVVFRHEIVGCIPRFSSSSLTLFLLIPTRPYKEMEEEEDKELLHHSFL